MNEALPPSGKILRGSEGLGTVTSQMIEERAREIARSEGRSQPNDLDRTYAREQLTGATSESEKLPTREEAGRDWQCHWCRPARKLQPCDLKTTKTSSKNWLKKVSRKPITISG